MIMRTCSRCGQLALVLWQHTHEQIACEHCGHSVENWDGGFDERIDDDDGDGDEDDDDDLPDEWWEDEDE